MVMAAAALCLVPLPAVAQGDHGDGHGPGGGCGDVFGDLVHIKRDDTTGQPILAMRWVEMPADEPGYGWGYCPIPVDEYGEELEFADLSCDVDNADAERVVEVDYFGRLNGSRTKPRNQRMHFNEVIENIKDSCKVRQDETGRLKMAFCDDDGQIEELAIVDSPMESMGLYIRLMKYGHIQTDPDEEDYWAHGDPATLPKLQPALGPEDWLKFHSSVWHLLPGSSDEDFYLDPNEPWYENPWITRCFQDIEDHSPGVFSFAETYTDLNKNGFYDDEPFIDLDGDGVYDVSSESFNPACADQADALNNQDFQRAAFFMAGAASKTGFVTRDLVQYFNRIGKVLGKEAQTVSPPQTLPALVRICDVTGALSQAEGQDEPVYENCTDDNPADMADLPNDDLFPDVLERFVDFSGLEEYDREDESVEVILNLDKETWLLSPGVSLGGWVEFVNGEYPAEGNIDGFVDATNDGIRSIEFVHNYAIPVDLYCKYDASSCL
jgi:hypothetical protein